LLALDPGYSGLDMTFKGIIRLKHITKQVKKAYESELELTQKYHYYTIKLEDILALTDEAAEKLRHSNRVVIKRNAAADLLLFKKDEKFQYEGILIFPILNILFLMVR